MVGLDNPKHTKVIRLGLLVLQPNVSSDDRSTITPFGSARLVIVVLLFLDVLDGSALIRVALSAVTLRKMSGQYTSGTEVARGPRTPQVGEFLRCLKPPSPSPNSILCLRIMIAS
jgi:hypothetical protein